MSIVTFPLHSSGLAEIKLFLTRCYVLYYEWFLLLHYIVLKQL